MGSRSRRALSTKHQKPRGTAVVTKAEQEETSLARFEATLFQGPLPPPEALARYEELCPGATDRLLAMAERQAVHRQAIETVVINSNARAQSRGPIMGFIVAMTVVGIGGYLISQGMEVSGFTALISALVAMVVPFIYGKQEQKKELAKKDRELVAGSWDYSNNSARVQRRGRLSSATDPEVTS